MDFFELIDRRVSVRDFLDKPIEQGKLNAILSAANRAPSAGNLQAFEIYVVKDPHIRSLLAEAALNQDFIGVAPVVLIFCSHPARSEWRYHERGVSLYALQDATIATTFAMLAATDLGLGCVWVGAFNEKDVENILRLPDGLRPVAILPIGYPSEIPDKRSRRSLDDLIKWL
jgi:nitroreductase